MQNFLTVKNSANNYNELSLGYKCNKYINCINSGHIKQDSITD